MTKRPYDVGRRRLLKGGLGLIFNPLAAASGVALPMSISGPADMLASVTSATKAAVLPHYLFKILKPLQASHALQLYPWYGTQDRPGQGVLNATKKDEHADEPLSQIRNALQRAIEFVADKQKNTPLAQRDYMAEIAGGLPQSIAEHFRGRIFDLLMVYGQEPRVLNDFAQQAKADEHQKDKFQSLFGDDINHKVIRTRIVEHINVMMGLFDAVDRLIPAREGVSLSALDVAAFDILNDAAQAAIRRNSGALSEAQKKAALDHTPAETRDRLAKMSAQEKVAILLRANLFLPCAFNLPADIQDSLLRQDYSHTRSTLTDNLAALHMPQIQAAINALRYDVAFIFTLRDAQMRTASGSSVPLAPSSLSSVMNMTANVMRSGVAGLASFFKAVTDISADKNATSADRAVPPPLSLPYQVPDILTPPVAQPKQAVPRDKNSPAP